VGQLFALVPAHRDGDRTQSMLRRSPIRLLAICTVGITGSMAVGSASAYAVGGGYTPNGAPPSAVAAGFTSVIEAQNITPAGGTLTSSYGGQSFVLTIPPHSLCRTKEVVITTPVFGALNVGPGLSAVAGIGVAFINPRTGRKYDGTLSPPVTLTITDSAIASGDMVDSITGPGQYSVYTAATVTKGSAVITFDSDPNFAVVAHNPTGGHPPGPGGGRGRPPHRWDSSHHH
jgi:hypothetical protein